MQSIILLLQNKHPTSYLDYLSLNVDPQDYIINEYSSFLDIGSGFGMAVWHMFIVVKCISVGIEIVPNRHTFAKNSFNLLGDNSNDFILKAIIADAHNRNRVRFHQDDAAKDCTNNREAMPYITEEGTHFSHILSFNVVFHKNDMFKIAERLNATDFKVLLWCKNEHQTQ